jgi:hypothetical protein
MLPAVPADFGREACEAPHGVIRGRRAASPLEPAEAADARADADLDDRGSIPQGHALVEREMRDPVRCLVNAEPHRLHRALPLAAPPDYNGGMPPMGDGTDDVPSAGPRDFIWWRGVPLCRRPQPDRPQQPRPPGKHLRSGVWLTDEQLKVYRLLRRQRMPVAKAVTLAKVGQSAPR